MGSVSDSNAVLRAAIVLVFTSLVLAAVTQAGAGVWRVVLAVGLAAALLGVAMISVRVTAASNRSLRPYVAACGLVILLDVLSSAILGLRSEPFGPMSIRIIGSVAVVSGLLWAFGPYIRERIRQNSSS